MIWEKAQELYQMEQAKTMGEDFKGLTTRAYDNSTSSATFLLAS
jgi:hypothetical protein